MSRRSEYLKGKSLSSFVNMSAEDFADLQKSGNEWKLRATVTAMSSAVNKRLREFQKRDIQTPATNYIEDKFGTRISTKDLTKGQLTSLYFELKGFAEAETYSARAGYSEHQLGLAVDILNGRWSYLSETDKEYEWLINNSYKYGYILRYPRDKEYVTGYVFEDWHFRYLGVELATKVYESNLTYDEYVARQK